MLSKENRLRSGLNLIMMGFYNFHVAVLIWCFINFITYLVYFVFNFWLKIRTRLTPLSIQIWDKIWSGILLIYIFLYISLMQNYVKAFNLGLCLKATIFLEGVRLLMKQYAFVRSNIFLAHNYKMQNKQDLNYTTFGHFVYFTFAPTMIYQNEYPRTNNIRWKFVARNVTEILGLIYFLCMVMENYIIYSFKDVCLRKYTVTDVLRVMFENPLIGIVILCSLFYIVLHCVQNIFAEILRFGDRMFYGEWWTSKSLSNYFRRFNVLVQDWLYTYIYQDMYEIVVPKNKEIATMTVFLVSVFVHEWIITNILNLFFPLQFFQFFSSSVGFLAINCLNKPIGNFLFLVFLAIGIGSQVNLYALEYFAVKNYPLMLNTTLGFYKPTFASCIGDYD